TGGGAPEPGDSGAVQLATDCRDRTVPGVERAVHYCAQARRAFGTVSDGFAQLCLGHAVVANAVRRADYKAKSGSAGTDSRRHSVHWRGRPVSPDSGPRTAP